MKILRFKQVVQHVEIASPNPQRISGESIAAHLGLIME